MKRNEMRTIFKIIIQASQYALHDCSILMIYQCTDVRLTSKKRIFFFFQNSAFYQYSRDLTDLTSE